ncbi:MAG: AMP-binding protein [Rikenellaceae bacterium]|jgi:long-chain acyl-CoA synthetase|nr:AMP-binding protein [Rikenellaceae bacterium]
MIDKTYATLKEMYDSSVALFSTRPAFSTFQQEQLTYAAFAERVEAFAAIYKQYGLKNGDKIALLSQNMPNWPAAYFAAVTAGMVIVPILPDFSAAEVDHILRHSDARALVVSTKQYPKIAPELAETLSVVICADDLSVLHGVVAPAVLWQEQTIDPEELAVIIYTSGTTSSPKGVMLSHRNLCTQVAMLLDIQDVQEWDIFVSLLPLSHTYECTLGMLLPFQNGASVVYISKAPTAKVLLPIFQAVRPTIVLSVPLIIEKIYRNSIRPQFTSRPWMAKAYELMPVRKVLHRVAGKKLYALFGGRLRFFGVGGAKLDPIVERFLYEAKFPYAIGYGLTETAPLLAGSPPSRVGLGTTGPTLKGVTLRIDNPHPASGEGEIVAQGPNVMMGYYKNPEATAEAFTADGWFRTKDLGHFDRDGYLTIRGRLGNMILGASGENIYPEEIEHVINSYSYVTDSLVKVEKGRLVALVEFNREELAKQYGVWKEELEAKIEQLREELLCYVNARVNRFSRLSYVYVQGQAFEKTPTHKIKRFLYH